MSFESPLSLLWLVLGVPIIILYVLKIRLRRQPVSTLQFWTQVVDEQNPRSLWQRLRHLVSLLLQLALLMLLTGAVADPYFLWEVRTARRIVLVLDHSASMNATDVAPSRLDEARRQAEQLVAGLRHRDEMAVIAVGSQPQVVVGFTSRARTLLTALKSIPQADGPSHVADAITLARRLQGERSDGKRQQVIVLTDGCFDGAADLKSPREDGSTDQTEVALRVIGKRTPNAGITQFQVRRSLVDPLGYEILVEVLNASDDMLECRFEVELDEEPIDVIPLTLQPGSRWSRTLEKTSAAGGRLVARLTPDDSLPVDNRAVAILPRREIQPVLLVTTGNLFLQKVFEVNPLVKLTVVDTVPTSVPPGTVVVFHRITPEQIPGGAVLCIDPANSTDLFQVGEPIANPIVTRQDRDHPLMSHVRLDNVLMPEARGLTSQPPESGRMLAEVVSRETVFLALERPAGRVLAWSVNLDKGDLPLRTAFPIAVSNALHWFSGNQGDLREALSTGSITSASQRDLARRVSATSLTLRDPAGNLSPLALQHDQVTIGPLNYSGVWTVQSQDAVVPDQAEPLLELACNLANAQETEIRPSVELLESQSAQSPVFSGLGTRPLWFWLLIAGLVLTSIEWMLYHRRVIS